METITEEKIYTEEEIKDMTAIKDYLKKSKDYNELAEKLTGYFSKKYGAEFGGNVVFEYDPTGNVMIMKCYDQDRIFEIEDELPEIASHLKFLRKAAAHKNGRLKE